MKIGSRKCMKIGPTNYLKIRHLALWVTISRSEGAYLGRGLGCSW